MAGVYVHIPFCRRACTYCNFHFSTRLDKINAMVDAILEELLLRKDYLGGQVVDTIYFGGGTPSLVHPGSIGKILERIGELFAVSKDAELTLEANPDDVNPARVADWKGLGFNRISLGVQSFQDRPLREMQRVHDARQALQAIADLQDGGIANINIDLIYGSPHLSDAAWLADLRQAVKLGLPHFSCYALTVEEGTTLFHQIRKKQAPPVDPETQARQFQLMSGYLQEEGYEHYEISNFALHGKRSRHNSAYWSGAHYLGIGPSAHSYDGTSRQWNIANNALYLEATRAGKVPAEREELGFRQRHNEYIMTALRTLEGISVQHLRETFGEASLRRLEDMAKVYINRGWMVCTPESFYLTPDGRLFADGIAGELFLE